MLAHQFSHFFAHVGERLHVTAHSHHPWPDVSRAAQARAWEDAATVTDRKWKKVFGEVMPTAQAGLAKWLNWPDPKQIAFAPNTHEFVVRLYSCLDWSRPLRVVTSNHEFHSFNRQTRRLEETGRLKVTRVPAEPYETFEKRFCEDLKRVPCDMVFLSQVFFDSGFIAAPNLAAIAAAAPAEALVAFDGYHAVGAIPVDTSAIADRAFYMGGGYKYLMSGEGACYMAVPRGCKLRPADTGWFAEFEDLEAGRAGTTAYAPDGMRFFGATFDPSGLYRLNAVLGMFEAAGVDAAAIHAHARSLQKQFLEALAASPLAALPLSALVPPEGVARGNFLTFDLASAEAVEQRLAAANIGIDRRGQRLRMGFGVYHDAEFVQRLLVRMRAALG